MNKKISAFTLIEVLIFTAILSMFFVAAAAVTVASLRNFKTQEYKILATRYAQELLDWLKGEKEADWNSFSARSGAYCFNISPIINWPSQGNCSTYGLKNFFKRQVILTPQGSPPFQVNVSISVEWQEAGGNLYQVPLKTVFTVWE